jgi:hypothetical protein
MPVVRLPVERLKNWRGIVYKDSHLMVRQGAMVCYNTAASLLVRLSSIFYFFSIANVPLSN